MKLMLVSALSVLMLCSGCGKSEPKPPPAGATTNSSGATTHTSEGHTWSVGAVTMNGTNVPPGEVQIKVHPATNAAPPSNLRVAP
jgi:hypothetical protein